MNNSDITPDIERLLIKLGISHRLIGFRYIVYIIELIVSNPSEKVSLTKWLYPAAAKHFKVSSESVERAIRVAAENIWECNDREALSELAGRKLTTRPTNGELINMLIGQLNING